MCSRIVCVVLLAMGAMVMCAPAFAGDIYVDTAATGAGNGSSWADAYTTIQAAINASSAADVIYVRAGTYVENINFSGKPITVTSENPPDPAVVAATVIDGGGSGSVATFDSGETASSVLTGFTLRNGTGTLIAGLRYGGGVFCGIGCSPTIRHCRITSCEANVGGGVYTKGNTPPVISSGPTAGYPYVGKNAEVTLSVSATDPDSDPLDYTWTPLDGGTITGSGSVVSFSASQTGPRRIRVTVGDGKGGTVTGEATVTVIGIAVETPIPQLAVGEVAALSAIVEPEIADTPEYPVAITWSLTEGPAAGTFDALVNGTPTAENIGFAPTASGPGRIEVRYDVGTASSSATAQIALNPIILSVSPTYGVIGTTAQPVIAGHNLARVTGVAVSGTGVTGSVLAGKTEDALPAEFVISAAASPGQRNILLTIPEGQIDTGHQFELRTPPPITANPTSLDLFTGDTGNITFGVPDPAPIGGTALTLSSSSPVVATVPATATILEGQTSVSVAVTSVAYGQTTITANAAGYYRAQVPVTVINPPLITFAPSPFNIAAGLVEKCTVSVSNPAPAGGLTVSLSGGGGLVTYPALVVISEAQFSKVFDVTGVAQGSTTLTANASGYPSANLPVNVGPGQLSLFPSYLPVAAGRSSSLQLSIPNAAPPGGLTVNVQSANPSIVAVPAAVTIPEGQKSVSVPVNGIIAGQTTITASLSGFQSAQATVNVLAQFNVSFLPGSLLMPPGVTKTTDVVISTAAPAGGVTITFANPSPDKVSVPESVFIPEGTYTTTISVTGVAESAGAVNIVASSPGLTEGTLPVTVQPILALYMRADVVAGVGTRTQGAIGFTSGVAPTGGYSVNAISDDPTTASVPAVVTIPAGSDWTGFTITGHKVGTTTIRLSLTGSTEADTVTVVTPTLYWEDVATTLNLGQTDQVRLRSRVIGGTYASGNWVGGTEWQNLEQAVTVSIASSDPAVISAPATWTIPAGRYYSDYFGMTAAGAGTATLTASATNYDSAETGTITVTGVTPYFRADVTAGIGTRTQGGVGLTTGVAPAGGYTFTLVSSDPAVATVPASVTIPQNSDWAAFVVTGVSVGTASITLTAPGGYTETDTVTVVTPTLYWEDVATTLNLGQTDQVRLRSRVIGGTYASGNWVGGTEWQNLEQAVTVSIASSDPAVISAPATWTIPAGRYYSDYFSMTAAGAGTATLTASATNYDSAETGTITVTGVTPYFRADVTAGVGTRTQGAVGLTTGVAPAGGYTFTLVSSDPAVATVPASVTIPQNSDWAAFVVTGVSVGTASITLTAPGGYTETDTVTVVTPTLYWEDVASTLNLAQTDQVRLRSRVIGGTYASGNWVGGTEWQNLEQAVTVSIASSDPAVISAPATWTIPAGRYYSDYFSMTAAGAGTATLTATAAGYNSAETGTIAVTGVTPYFRADVTAGVGTRTQGAVGLTTGVAPAGGYTFTLATSDPAVATVPASVTIPQNSDWAAFVVTGVSVGTASITLTAPGGYTETDTVTVVTPTLYWENIPTDITIGAVRQVRLRSRVIGGTYASGNWVGGSEWQNQEQAVTASLSSLNTGVIQVPASITLPAGRYYSDYFNMAAVGTGSSTLTASAPLYSDGTSAVITTIGPWLRADVTVGVGTRTTGYLGLTNGVAPTGGYTIGVTLDVPGIIGVPATVTIPAGSDQAAFSIVGLAVGETGVQIAVSGFADRKVATAVKPTFQWDNVASSLLVGQNDQIRVFTYVPGGTYASGNWIGASVNQNPDQAVTVSVSSENPTVLTAPAAISIPAGRYYSDYFNMSGVAAGTSTLTASALEWDSKTTGTITVNAAASTPASSAPYASQALDLPSRATPMAATQVYDEAISGRSQTSGSDGGAPALMLPAMAVIGQLAKLDSSSDPGLPKPYEAGGWNTGPVIEYNTIVGNTATTGGGLTVYNSDVTVRGNIFAANTAITGGGAIYVDGPLASATVVNNTICANTGGIGLGAGSASITQCILWQNGWDLVGCSAAYSDVTNLADDPGTGNVSSDPVFVQTSDSAAAGYYRLGAGSPCINAGNPAYSPASGETDIDGQGRIASGRVDIGADEYPDTNAPQTQITGGPADNSTACSLPVAFNWWGTDDTPQGITYSYRLDSGDWSSWAPSTSFSFAALADGTHVFEVKARDSSGNEDPTPALRSFKLDTTAPAISQVAAGAGRTSASITWVTDEGSTSQVVYGLTDTYEQVTYLDWMMAVQHSVTLNGLAPGVSYHYRVKSRDNCGREAISEDQVFMTAADDTAPDTQMTAGPSEGSNVCSVPVNFGFIGLDDSTPTAGLVYSCRVDAGSWSASDSATTAAIDGLAAGDHSFEVKAKDASGNEDASPAIRHFGVKLDPPVISNVQSSVAQMQCTITWTTDQGCTSQVEYGPTAAYGTLSPLLGSMVESHSMTISGLEPSTTYHFVVRSRDVCGREGLSSDQTFSTPADNGEPNTSIVSGPSEGGRACSSSVELCWSGSDTVTPSHLLVYAYKLDTGGWSTPSANTCRTFTDLAEGGHTVYVRAQDTSGNADSTPAQRSFTVDLSIGTLYNINAATGATEATIVWQSTEPMDSQVEYGADVSYGSSTPLDTALVSTHTVVITGLAPDAIYHYRVKSGDGCGRAVVSTDKVLKTAPDQNAPNTSISSGPAENGKACSTSVDLCWTGTDNATPAVQLVYAYKMDADPWSAWAASLCNHFENLAEGLHTFMVKAKDTAGNEDISPAVRYFYVDLTPPAVTPGSINYSARQSTCTINWRTGEPCTSQVEYGTTQAYDKVSGLDANMLSAHRITLSGLTPETTYHFRVRSSDGCQEVVSEDMTFTTAAIQPPNIRPIQLTLPISTSAHSTVKIAWVVQNVGPGDAEGSWMDRIYFSDDEIPDAQDGILWESAGNSPLPVPYNYSKQAEVLMPMKPVGTYYVILKSDADGALSESNETDNMFVQPVAFTADKPLIAAPENIAVRLDPLVAGYGQFDLSNIGDTGLTGITSTISDAAPNISLSVSNVVPQMDALTNRRISFQVTATDESVVQSSPKVTFTTDQGASAAVVMNLTITPRQPKLVANPGYMSGPMVRGQQTFYECEITNQGGVPASDMRVVLPESSWLKLISPADLGSIGAGEKKTVSLSLNPTQDMALGDYQGSFVVGGTNANVSVSFRFTCVSVQTGSLKVTAEDEFTTFAEDHPYVSGATVTLKDYTTGEVKYQGTTGADGIWLKSDITEANYLLEVAAPKHGTYRSPLVIVAGQTKEVQAFLPRQLVSYTWVVEPIQIEDKYRIVLEATFETHVPAPVVTIEPRTQVVPVVEGQTATSYIIVANHGLIAAHEVQVDIGDTDTYYVQPAIRMIGELPAMTSVQVPIYVRAKSDGPITDLPQTATSTLAAEAAAAKTAQAVPQKAISLAAETGGGAGTPSLCDVLNGKVVHVVYCSGGQWQTADFSMSPIIFLLNVIDGLGCVAGNIQSCISLACGLAKIDPCICALVDPLSAGGAYNAAQCLACHGLPGGGGDGSGGGGYWGGGGGWPFGPGNISGPSIEIEQGVPCDPATRPQSSMGTVGVLDPRAQPNVLITTPSDIAKYGGKQVRYRVNLLQ